MAAASDLPRPDDALAGFGPATRAWFEDAFAEPTAAQGGAWAAIRRGEHALVVAPTGSGKTLAAFLWALDRLSAELPPAEASRRCRVLYVSPLKALAVDVERNLRVPLAGIRQAAARLGLAVPDLRVAVRSGDTPAAERRAFVRAPADVLITTPESLFLLLTSRARELLAGVTTVVIDEVHALAGSKRGAHLALSLARLDALLPAPAQRVGLSATVRPVTEVARWLSGTDARPVRIVQPATAKTFDLQVVVPVPDLSLLDAGPAPGDRLGGSTSEQAVRPSIWPHVEERIVDLIDEHRSTLVFANSRRLAERLTSRLNEVWHERQDAAAPLPDPGSVRPSEMISSSDASRGAPTALARAHHGSVSKEQRALIEGDLKAGRLPAVVATSSLELGIDMGAIDLVVQVESPPSVASGLQRVGRAGHQVGAVSRGVLFPKYRSDLVSTAVVVERMRTGLIEELTVPANPLDVLAQQIVAMVAMDTWAADDLLAVIRRTASFATLGDGVFEAVLDMLAGRYPSDAFAQLRPRIVWDRVTGTLTARPGAQRLAVTSGGTIPDRGLFPVFLAAGDEQSGGGRRVGELDEEMVYESRVGDVFTLGSSSWRVEQITPQRVLVSPAPGLPGRVPFWHGDALGRPAELGTAIGAFIRELSGLDAPAAHARVRAAGLDPWAADNLLTYLAEQRQATGQVPDDHTLVVERFRDELGDWRVVIHSSRGARVHAPWALGLAARFRERFGVEVSAMPADDGIVLRLPDLETEDGRAPEVADLLVLDPDQVEDLITTELGGSALFAARFRECAGRALLLPRQRPGVRQPLWQQRQRAAHLLEIAAQFPRFPIVLETVRECLQDVFDVPGLTALMRDLDQRRVHLLEVETPAASPFARSLLFGYVAQFLYEGDSPLAERRAAALSVDPELLAELLGRGEGAALRDLLDPAALARTEAQAQRLSTDRRLPGPEGVADLLRLLGPLDVAELARRTLAERLPPAPATTSAPATAIPGAVIDPDAPDVPPLPEDLVLGWLSDLRTAGRVIPVRLAGQPRWAAIEDAGRLRDALGTALPAGVAAAFTEPVADPLGDLLSRYARTHGPFTAAEVAGRFGLGVAVALEALRRLVIAGRVVEGELRPLTAGGGTGTDYCDAEILRTVRRRSLAALRAEVEPVPRPDLARFLPRWQGLGGRAGRGPEGVLHVVEQLAGALLPVSALETLILPARVPDYSPAMLDELTGAGEVVWSGHGSLTGDDGWVALHPAELAPATLPDPDPDTAWGPVHEQVLAALAGGGGHFFRAVAEHVPQTHEADLVTALWDLVWAGLVTNDTLAPLRAWATGSRSTRQTPTAASAARYRGVGQPARFDGRPGPARRGRAGARRGFGTARATPPTAAGRWALLPARDPDPTLRAHARTEVLLDRHGILTRGAVAAERVGGSFSSAYRVLRAFEDAGRVRRGYFVEGLGAAQFAGVGAVDLLRTAPRPPGGSATGDPPVALVLAAADPANPYGAALAWPGRVDDPTTGHRPGRKAGALVVLVDGALVLYVERGGRSLLSWSQDPELLAAAAQALAGAVRHGGLGRLTVERTDGRGVLRSGQPLTEALAAAGFHATSRGLRIRG